MPLIKQSFLMHLPKKPPNTFDIFIVISHIWGLHIHPISYLLSDIFPFAFVFHYIGTASFIIIFYRYFRSNIFFSNTQFFFYTKLNGQPMSIPTCLSIYLKSFKGFVSAKKIFYSTRNHMMNTWHSICRWRSFIKSKCWISLSTLNTLSKNIRFSPIV